MITIGGQNPSLEILKLGYLREAHTHLKKGKETQFEKEIKKCVPRLRKVSLEVIHNITMVHYCFKFEFDLMW